MIFPNRTPASILWDLGSLPRAPSEFKLSHWVNFSCALRAASSICCSAAQVVWKTSGWPLTFRPWLPDSWFGYHSFLSYNKVLLCTCLKHEHAFAFWVSGPLKLWSYTHSHCRELPGNSLLLPFQHKFVRMLNQSNHNFHMYSTILFIRLFLLTVLQKPLVVWTEVSVVVSWTLHGCGWRWFCWLWSKTAPRLMKNLAPSMSESFALAFVYKRSNKIRDNLPAMQPVFYQSVCTQIQSWPKAKQWRRERREVKDWDSVNTETKMWWPRAPIAYTHCQWPDGHIPLWQQRQCYLAESPALTSVWGSDYLVSSPLWFQVPRAA